MGIKFGDDTHAEKYRINLRINRGYGKKQVGIKGKKEGDPPRWISAPPEPNPAAAVGHIDWPTNDEGKINRWVAAQKPLDEEASKKMLYYASNAFYSSFHECQFFPFGFEGFPALDDNPFSGRTIFQSYATQIGRSLPTTKGMDYTDRLTDQYMLPTITLW